jgi:hypothetical protein
MTTCAVPDINLGFLVMIRFLEPANILAILLVLVTNAAYMIAKLIPGNTRDTKQVALVGLARSVNVVP